MHFTIQDVNNQIVIARVPIVAGRTKNTILLIFQSVINVMDKEWLGGWGSLLTGKLIDDHLRKRVIKLVDDTINDWG